MISSKGDFQILTHISQPPNKKLKMILKIFKKIKIFSLLLKLSKVETNDYALGYKVRRILNSYKENKKLKEEEIFKETPKP